MRALLLLPAPTRMVCQRCGITSDYAKAAYDMSGLYFVDYGQRFDDPGKFIQCNICWDEYMDELRNPPREIHLSRGVPEWCPLGEAFYGFADMPMLCVTAHAEDGWRDAKPQPDEVWLFFRNRQEWRSAWQIARTIVRDGEWPLEKGLISNFLPAYRPAGSTSQIVAVMRLNEHARLEGPKVGICDSCGKANEIVMVRPGTQWSECLICRVADSAPVGEEAE